MILFEDVSCFSFYAKGELCVNCITLTTDTSFGLQKLNELRPRPLKSAFLTIFQFLEYFDLSIFWHVKRSQLNTSLVFT